MFVPSAATTEYANAPDVADVPPYISCFVGSVPLTLIPRITEPDGSEVVDLV